jgi:DMSO/TMAO reductase YedYZ molybdopterin-dependent catalytic subunit
MNGREELWRAWQRGDLDRRSFLCAGAAGALALLPRSGLAFSDDSPSTQLLVREKDPINLESPFAKLDGFLTPNKMFYVRNHFTAPTVEATTWKLTVTGAVEKPLELTYDQVLALPSRTTALTLECAGNGRQYLEPKAKGVQWGLGAVSTAEWTGVTLATLLEKAGVKKNAVDVVLEGADTGEAKNDPKPVGQVHFLRGLPLAKALKPEVLLAYKMNGEVLPALHGFPLRAMVGGWYGMASVKWLQRIVVTDKPFHGYDETTDYSYWEKRDGLPTMVPLTEMVVKASIARPAAGELLLVDRPFRVHGAAWAGESEIAKVELSTDGGKTWTETKLLGQAQPMTWRLWEYDWKPTQAGKPSLIVRATDKRGRTQPLERDPNRRSYMINHLVPTEVEVK